jgi:anaerobic ribonucleoside-triphosphate reductase activating protein
LNYAQIREYDIANGTGIRTTVFISGCTRRCPECFNEEYQNFHYGKKWTDDTTQYVIDCLAKEEVAGLSILGGEPFQNLELIDILLEIHRKSDKPIWIYSGYTYEEIMSNSQRRMLFSLADVLVDGPFIKELRDPNLKFRGSSNQRIIDVNQSLLKERLVLKTY